MGLGTKIADFMGGSIFKEVKELALAYLPPSVSPEKRAEFELRMNELQIQKQAEAARVMYDTLQAELRDTQSAREAHKMSKMPAVITVMLTLMVCGLLYALMEVNLEQGNREIAIGLFGIVFSQWAASIQYWVGTTRSSSEKNQLLANSTPDK